MAELWDIYDANGNKTGRLHKRGMPLQKGDFALYVMVWVVNQKGEFLVTKRAPDRGDCWHTTGGCAITGDDSLAAALREAREEIGIVLDPEAGQLFKRYNIVNTNGGGAIADVWLFVQEVDISDVVLCPIEIADAKWANSEQIKSMTHDGSFNYPYLDELFAYCDRLK